MDFNKLVERFMLKPYLLNMGKGSLSKRFKCSPEQIVKAKKKARGADSHNLKILILDIETAPLKAYVWRRWKQNVHGNQLISDWFMLTWAAKWINESESFSDKLTPQEVKDENDNRICQSLWSLMDKADIIITHNGDRFDLPKIKSRFLVNKLTPVSPFKSIDTCKIAKSQFGFSSNSLDELAKVFKFDGKIGTSMSLWIGCMDGDAQSLEDMETYNVKDIIVLEELYIRMRPFIAGHPNVTIHMELKSHACTTCGSDDIYMDGTYTTQSSVFNTFRCNACGSIAGRSRKSLISKDSKINMLMPIR